MPRSVCYWINSAVNLALHPNLSPSSIPLGNPSLKYLSYTLTPGELWNWLSREHFLSGFQAGLVLPQRPDGAPVLMLLTINWLWTCGHCHQDPPQGEQQFNEILNSIYRPLETNTFLWSLRNPSWEQESNSLVPVLTGNWREENAASLCFSSVLQFTKHLLLLVLPFHPDTIPGGRQSRH